MMRRHSYPANRPEKAAQICAAIGAFQRRYDRASPGATALLQQRRDGIEHPGMLATPGLITLADAATRFCGFETFPRTQGRQTKVDLVSGSCRPFSHMRHQIALDRI